MDFDKNEYFKGDPWGIKEGVWMLGLSCFIVPVFIEILLREQFDSFFRNGLYAGTTMGFIMAIVFMLGVYFVCLRPCSLSWKEVGFRRFAASYWGAIAGWTIVLIFSSIMVLALMMAVGGTYENEKTESVKQNVTVFNFFIGFISAAIISPVYEEILYRGFIYRWIRVRTGKSWGMFISSFLFMVVHIPTYNTLMINFISGLVFAWAYEKTGSIWPSVLIHGLFNGLAVILTFLE
jgi:membrane protease YdiL (CAAX protease family)